MTHLVLGKNAKGKAIALLGEGATAEAAATIGEMSKAVDYHVIPPTSLAELGMGELVAIFNSLVQREDAVTRFENRLIGANRILGAWSQRKFDLASEPAKVKKPRGQRTAKVNGAAGETAITLRACPANKRWQANSDRKKVYDYLVSHSGAPLTVAAVQEKSGVEPKKVLGCLSKLAASKLIELK